MANHDTEFTDRFMENLRRAEQHCRECDHTRYQHRKADNGCLTYIRDVNSTNLKQCTCVEFVPLDNLEYIEWLAIKKGII